MIIGAWLFLKGVYKFLMSVYVPLLLAGIVLLTVSGGLIWKWGVADHHRKVAEREVVKLDKANASLKSDLASCNANVDELTVSLERQNAAVDLLKSESDARAKRAAAAVRMAQEQARGMQRTIARLQAARPSGDVCTSARSLIVETLSAER